MLTRSTELSTTKLTQSFCVLSFCPKRSNCQHSGSLNHPLPCGIVLKIVTDCYASVQVLIEVLNEDKKVQEACENYDKKQTQTEQRYTFEVQ